MKMKLGLSVLLCMALMISLLPVAALDEETDTGGAPAEAVPTEVDPIETDPTETDPTDVDPTEADPAETQEDPLPEPEDHVDVVMYAEAQDPVSYLNDRGGTETCSAYTVVTAQTTTLTGIDDQPGWYVVSSSVTVSERITVTGDVHLILADSQTLNASQGITVASGNSFTVYAQSWDKKGTLKATGIKDTAGIGGGTYETKHSGTITINGGNVTATGGEWSAGIGRGEGGECGTIIINGGNVTATGGRESPGIGGGARQNTRDIIINGGTVNATGNKAPGIGDDNRGTVTIRGGNVTARGGNGAPGIRDGTIDIHGGNVTANGGSPAQQDRGAGIQGIVTIIGGTVTANGGDYAMGIKGSVIIHGGTVKASAGRPGQDSWTTQSICGIDGNVTVTGGMVEVIGKQVSSPLFPDGAISGKLFVDNTSIGIAVKHGSNAGDAKWLDGTPFRENNYEIPWNWINKSLYIKLIPGDQVAPYLDENGVRQICETFNVYTGQSELTEGWHVVRSNVEISDRITVTGGVHLILADGYTLTAREGITVASGNSLSVYAQSTKDQMGALNATTNTASYAGIGGTGGSVTINGGNITAHGSTAGIGGSGGSVRSVTINGGRVDAHGSIAGIDGSAGSVIIKGGTVTANSGSVGIAGPLTTGQAGSAFIDTRSINNQTGVSDWHGAIIIGNIGKVYGGNVTLKYDATVPQEKNLLIPENTTLATAQDVTLTNNGTIYVKGALTENIDGDGDIYYPLTVNNGKADNTVTYLSTVYAKVGDTITLTANHSVGQTATWTSNQVTVSGNSFTMPAMAVTVTAVYRNDPQYTVTIPGAVEIGTAGTVTAADVNIVEGCTLKVTMGSTDFTLKTAEGATLDYEILKDNTLLHAGDTVLEIPGGTEDDKLEKALTFALKPNQPIIYSGTYAGTVQFTVSLENP